MRPAQSGWPLAALTFGLVVLSTAGVSATSAVPRVGFVLAGSPQVGDLALSGFRQGLRDLGHVEGQTISLELRWADGKPERYSDLVADLLRVPVDVIVVSSVSALPAVTRATGSTPVVAATMGDPVAAGLAATFARPGGNVTGLTLANNELLAKRVQLLKEAVPGASRVTLLRNPRPATASVRIYEAAAEALNVKLQVLEVRRPSEFEGAFLAMVRWGAHALLLAQDPLFAGARGDLAALALKHRLPTMSGETGFAEAGGLMNYGPSIPANFRRAAAYVDKILRGARPGDLPIEQPTKFELAINVRTARALGLTVPTSLLVWADHTIE